MVLSVFCRWLYNFALYGVLGLWCVFVRLVVVSALCGACGASFGICGRSSCFRFGFSAVLAPFPLWMLAGCGSVARSGFIYGPLWAFVLFRVCFFIRGAFCRPVGVPCVVSDAGRGSAFGRGCSVVFAWSGFGYNMPVVFSGSFSDPLRLLLFSLFNNSRRRASFPVAVLRVGWCGLICFYYLPAFV